MVLGILMVLGLLVYTGFQGRVYEDYEVLESHTLPVVEKSRKMPLGESLLVYSPDGAFCADRRGQVLWNQTYEMQDILLATEGDVAALGAYNGREIYVASSAKILVKIDTSLPIRSLAVSRSGRVAVALEDGRMSRIHVYDEQGHLLVEGTATMTESGYPLAMAFSPGGSLLAISYLYLDAGVQKSTVAFFQLGEVGENYSDYLVSSYAYDNALIPTLFFLDEEHVVAVGDGQALFFQGAQKPTLEAAHLYSGKLQAVYWGSSYVALQFPSDTGEQRFRLEVYGKGGRALESYYYDEEYDNIQFFQNTFVAYNSQQAWIQKIGGVGKYRGNWKQPVQCLLPSPGAYRYTLVGEGLLELAQFR